MKENVPRIAKSSAATLKVLAKLQMRVAMDDFPACIAPEAGEKCCVPKTQPVLPKLTKAVVVAMV